MTKTILLEDTIAQAIRKRPEALDVFAEAGIDFCCGGGRQVGEAIKGAKLEEQAFLTRLNEENKKRATLNEDLYSLSTEDLIDHLIDAHHRPEESWFETLDRLLGTILDVHYAHHGEELTEIYRLFCSLKAELAAHFAREERMSFPKMLEEDFSDKSILEDEHDAAGDLLHKLEAATNGFTPPADGCETYRYAFDLLKQLSDDIHVHVFVENNILLPRIPV